MAKDVGEKASFAAEQEFKADYAAKLAAQARAKTEKTQACVQVHDHHGHC